LGELELCTHADDCSSSYQSFFICEGWPAATLVVEVLSGWLDVSPSLSYRCQCKGLKSEG